MPNAAPALCDASCIRLLASKFDKLSNNLGSHSATSAITPIAIESEYGFCRKLVNASKAWHNASIPHVAVGYGLWSV